MLLRASVRLMLESATAERVKQVSFSQICHNSVLWTLWAVSCRLTDGQAVIANSDSSCPHWHTAGQAAQHRLNRVALGLMTMEDHLLLQLHRFKVHVALWKRVKHEGKCFVNLREFKSKSNIHCLYSLECVCFYYVHLFMGLGCVFQFWVHPWSG